MDEQQLRDQLNAKLRRKTPIPDVVWERIKPWGHASGSLMTRVDWADLIDGARDELKYLRKVLREGFPARRRGIQRSVAAVLSQYETDRAGTLAEYKAHLAGSDRTVRTFREDILDGRALSPAEAQEFLDSPALRTLPRSYFTDQGIPFIGHRATALPHRMNAMFAPYLPPEGWEGTLRIEWPGGSVAKAYRWGEERRQEYIMAPLQTPPLWEPPDLEDDQFGQHAWPDSVHFELWMLGNELASEFYWRRADARRFVLTGTVPEVTPLDARFEARPGSGFDHGRIVLSIDPSVSPDAVKRAYGGAQRAMLRGDNRGPSETSLAVFRFVLSHMDLDGHLPGFPQMLARWNEAHPEHPFRDRAAFRRAYVRGKRGVAYPGYRDEFFRADMDDDAFDFESGEEDGP